MVSTPHLYSLVHFGIFTLSLFFGSYSIYINPRSKTNRMFFILSLSLCAWALGFSLSNMSPQVEEALLWRKISGLGRVTIHVVLLHMILCLSNKRDKIKSWQLMLLYLPAIILLYTLVFSNTISPGQYKLVLTYYGWVNTASGTIWNLVYTFYNILYMIFNYIILNEWEKITVRESEREQARFLKKALILTLALGTLTDVVLNLIFGSKFPQLGPILSIVPIIALFHLVRKNRFLAKSDPEEYLLLLDKRGLYKLYYYASTLYFAGATINSLQFFLPELLADGNKISNITHTSLTMYFTGAILIALQLITNSKVRAYLAGLIIFFSIPAITLNYLETASITIWVFPLVLMILTVIMDHRLPLIFLLISGVLTQLLVWKHAPKGLIAIDEIDYILRILILFLAFTLGFLINRMYSNRLAENIHQNKLQKLLSDLSFELIYANIGNFREKMEDLLKKIGQFMEVEVTFLVVFGQANRSGHYFWFKETLEKEEILRDTVNDDYSFMLDIIKENKIYKEEKENLLVLPIEEAAGIVGLIGCKSYNKTINWLDNENLLRTLANIMGSLIGKIKGEEEIKKLAFYDQLTGLPNRILFSDRLNQALLNAQRKKNELGLIFFDLDNFKVINDTKGHAAGDLALKEVVERILLVTRKTSSLSRFAGDEFLIMEEDFGNKENLIAIAERLLKALQDPFIIEGDEFYLTASMGIALYPKNGNNVDMLIRNADRAMYIAKERGKNQYAFCQTQVRNEDIKNL